MPPLLAPALISLGVGAEIAGPLASILFTGLSIALSIIFAPDVPKPEAGRIPFKQQIPSRTRIIGRRRNGGSFMLYYSAPGGTFFGVQAICEGPANAFLTYWLHDIAVGLTGNTVTDKPGSGVFGDGKVKIYTRLGIATETAYPIAVAETDGIWTDDHRGDGIASALLYVADASEDKQARRFPFGLPVLSVEVDATQVFDPREMTSSPAQDWADPTTWSGTGNDNPMLAAMWFFTATLEEGGMGLDFEETFLPVLTEVAAQADICDEPVAVKAGGTDKRYTSSVLYNFATNPGDVLAAILGTCDGFCAERGDGAFELKAGIWDADDFAITLTDHHIISLNVKRFKPDEDEVTGVIVKYCSRAQKYADIDAPVWPRDAYQGGEDHRVRSIDVTYCTNGRQAQRLGKRVATYEMAPVTGTAVLNMYGILLLDRRGATINCTDDPALMPSADSPLETIKIRLTRVEPNLLNGTVEIDFQVFDPVVADAWDAATEEGPNQDDSSVETPLPGEFSTPTGLNAVAYQVGSIINVDVSFDPGTVAGDNTMYNYRWRFADIGGGVPGGWTFGGFGKGEVNRDGGADFWVVTFNNMPVGEIEIQLQAHQHDHSEWSVSVTVNTAILAPGTPQNFDTTTDGAVVVLTWDAPNSTNMDHARVYRAVSGAGIGLAVDISGEIAGVANAAMTYTDNTATPGTWDYWVSAETIADIASTPVGPETEIITDNALNVSGSGDYLDVIGSGSGMSVSS